MRWVLKLLTVTVAWAILVGAVLGYGGGVVFALDALAHFRLHFLLAVPLFALIALLFRQWAVFWRLTVAAVLLVAGLGPLWETPARLGVGKPLRIMTANIYQHNRQPDAVQATFLAADADVLVTNETQKSLTRGAGSLAARYPYRLSLSTTGEVLRTVIWSRYPMREGRLLLDDLVEPTGAHAIIDLGEGFEVSVLAMHLAHPIIGNQQTQIEALDRLAEGLPYPRIVLGDFNATPWSWAVMRIEKLTGTRRIGGYRPTWAGIYPNEFGRLRALLGQPIDHILVSDTVGVVGIETVTVPGSDHKGIVADLLVPATDGFSDGQ